MRVVSRAEESLDAVEETRMVLTPFHAPAGTEVLAHAWVRMEQGKGDLIGTSQVHWAGGVGQARRLHLVEPVRARHRVVLDIATRGLIAEPLTHVAFARAGSRRQFSRRERGRRQGLVQP